jgi:sulfatase modifying factor 1
MVKSLAWARLIPLVLPVWLGAAGLHLEEAGVGGRRVVASFDDSVLAPDLNSIRLKGYDIEHAAFVEESDTMELSADLWDLTAPNAPRMIQRSNSDSTLFLIEAPSDWVPRPGVIFTDTALGGILAKVIAVKPSPDSPLRFWVKTQPAFLNDAIVEGEIRFKMQLDLNALFADQHIQAELPGQDTGVGEMNVDLSQAKVLFQPVISGVLRIHNGLMERAGIYLRGPLDISGRFEAALQGQGRFSHREVLPIQRGMFVPLGHGLCLNVREEFALRIEANAVEKELSGQASLHAQQAMSADLVFNFNRWQPTAEVNETSDEKPEIAVRGKGSLRFTLEPRLEFSLNGQPASVLTLSPSIRIANRPALDSATAPAVGGGMAWWKNTLSLRAQPLSSNSEAQRDFLLLNRERVWIGTPLQGQASIVQADSNSVTLQCRTEPQANFFVVQRLTQSRTWETILFNTPGPLIKLEGLYPGAENRFRVIGVNAYGAGPAFPPEGITYAPAKSVAPPTLLASLPVPIPLQPDTMVKADSGVWLTWTLPKSDGHNDTLFNVYLGPQLGSMQPVAQSLRDTQLWVSHLDSGKTYFWKVEYVEGTRFNDGPPKYFTYLSTKPRPHAASAVPPPVEGMVFISAGTFKRSDGRRISVGPLYLQKYEVMQKDFRRVTGSNPSFHEQDSLPVERVTWEEASQYCHEVGGRLPTEAEWEFAARAGETGRFYWGNRSASEYARFRDNSDNHTWPVGSLKPNALGLYDMAGNVFEWTQDWFGDYAPDDLVNPKGPPTGDAKVIRGASWYSDNQSLDLSTRFSNRPNFRNFKLGIRCAKDAPASAALAGSHP